jgi:hypothetical protein
VGTRRHHLGMACNIQGILGPSGHYYYPLKIPTDINLATRKSYSAASLPLRTDGEIRSTMDKMEALPRQQLQQMQRDTGINGPSVLRLLPTLNLSISFPPDPMHTIFINMAKDMYSLWRGLSLLNSNTKDDYVLEEADWKEIGEEMILARKTTPASWGRPPRNIFDKWASMKAEEWKSWILRWSIPLLYNRLPAKYLRSWYEFVRTVRLAVSSKISDDSIKSITSGFQKWAQNFET